MSTRCNIQVIDGEQKQYLYKHFDGYPKGVTPHLDKVVDKLNGNCDLLMQRITAAKDVLMAKFNDNYHLFVEQIVASAKRDIVGSPNGENDIDFAIKTILEDVPGVEKVNETAGDMEYLYTVLKEDGKWSYSYEHIKWV